MSGGWEQGEGGSESGASSIRQLLRCRCETSVVRRLLLDVLITEKNELIQRTGTAGWSGNRTATYSTRTVLPIPPYYEYGMIRKTGGLYADYSDNPPPANTTASAGAPSGQERVIRRRRCGQAAQMEPGTSRRGRSRAADPRLAATVND